MTAGAKYLPDLNWDADLRVQDFKVWSSNNEAEILNRFKSIFGSFSLATPRSGVVDAVDPQSVVSTDTSRPLLVYVSTNNPLQINITPGWVVNPNGTFVEVPSLIQDLDLASSVAGAINVVYVENEIIDDGPNVITRYNTPEPPRRIQSSDKVRVASLSDFTNSVLFTPDRKSNITSIAIVKVVQIVSGLELQFDYTSSVYAWNRPWFSPVDVEHRSKVGTGVVSDTNPHATTFNDLSSGNLTLYDQILQVGQIQSKDDDVKGNPGFLCTESITPSRILTDTTGVYTSASRFGGINAKYIVLSAYPSVVFSFIKTTHKNEAISYEWIPGTRIIVLPGTEVFTVNTEIKYNRVNALELPNAITSNTIVFSQPNANRELVYSGGNAITEFVNPSIDFDGSGPVPREYTVFLKQDRTLLRTPDVIAGPVLVDSMGTALYPVEATLFGPAQLSIGLADANPVVTMNLPIRIYGKDINGTAITEDLTFTGGSWTPVTLPGVETDSQSIRTSNIFAEVTDLQILPGRLDDGPSSKIVLFAEYETHSTPELNSLARACTLSWDGLAAKNFKDARNVKPQLSIELNRFKPVGEMIAGLNSASPRHIFSEDLRSPTYAELTKGYQDATNSEYAIFISDYSLINAGDQIEIRPGKICTAITVGVPNRTIGQFLAATSNQATRDDLAATINFVPFASDFVATPDAGDVTRIDMERQTVGAVGNEAVTTTLSNPTSITLSSNTALGGIDSFGEIYLPRHDDQLVTSIPNVLTYDVSSIRKRYLSRAIPINNKKRIVIIIHGIPTPQSTIQVRARVAQGNSIWKVWEVISGVGSYFTFTKASDITKVQIQLFGTFEGYSLYEGDL